MPGSASAVPQDIRNTDIIALAIGSACLAILICGFIWAFVHLRRRRPSAYHQEGVSGQQARGPLGPLTVEQLGTIEKLVDRNVPGAQVAAVIGSMLGHPQPVMRPAAGMSIHSSGSGRGFGFDSLG